MNHIELKYLIHELQEIDKRFKIGLTMFVEGAQGFHGNLRLLLDTYHVMKNEQKIFDLVEKRRLKIAFVGIGETFFVLLY